MPTCVRGRRNAPLNQALPLPASSVRLVPRSRFRARRSAGVEVVEKRLVSAQDVQQQRTRFKAVRKPMPKIDVRFAAGEQVF
jgi:hypothetical protein